jgi:hypothetical protein
MIHNSAPIFGGMTVLGDGPTRLTDEKIEAMRQLTIRVEPTALGMVYFGGQDVADRPCGYIIAKEVYGFGPFSLGCGIRPGEFYLLGNAGIRVYWNAFAA